MGRRKRCPRGFLDGKQFATDLSCIIGPFTAEKWSRSCRAIGRLPQMPVLPCHGSDGRESTEWVAAGVPRWGLSSFNETKLAILDSKNQICFLGSLRGLRKVWDSISESLENSLLRFLDVQGFRPLVRSFALSLSQHAPLIALSCKVSTVLASSLRVASAGCAKRKQL